MVTAVMRRRRLALLSSLLLVATALAVLPGSNAGATPPFSIIDNGTVQLGVHAEGHLNVPGGVPSSGTGTTFVGLRFLPTGAEATSPGCLCEGWGVWDSVGGASGYVNEALGSASVVVSAPPVATPNSVITQVDAAGTFRVTHDYHPSATPFLYEVTVTIENISAAAANAVYRRVMDWDVEPTAFSEFVTIQGTPSALVFSSDNGFATSDPSVAAGFLLFSGEAVDSGPSDHGAVFDFDFGNLNPGETTSFNTYYGAADTEANAIAALAAVSAELFSFGQPNVPGGPDLGTPNTFIFAFSGVGGPPLFGADIDIKPGSDPNSINLKQGGKNVIPVAILGTDSFDVTTVDPSTLEFGPDGATPIHGDGHLEDVNDDGFLDHVSHYLTSETGIASGDTEACLSAEAGGNPFTSCDAVRTLF